MTLFRLLIASCSVASLSPAVSAQDPKPAARPGHKRFYVMPWGRGEEVRDAVAYVEFAVKRSGIAVLGPSADECDYVLVPGVRSTARVTQVDHKRTIETEQVDAQGKKTKKKEERTAHVDDVVTVTTEFTCIVRPPGDYRQTKPLFSFNGQVVRTTKGKDTPGHDANDQPIKIRDYQLDRYERELGSPQGNSAQPALYKTIFDLCNLNGKVTEIDKSQKRITVDLGSDDGIQAKDDPDGVSELELFVQTGNKPNYVYMLPSTGRLYTPDKKTVDAKPDSPADWSYRPDDTLPGERLPMLRGPEVDTLQPLGERMISWAEVQELFRASCTLTPKRKGDFGRTQDDDRALNALPDPKATPIIARVRVKHGMLKVNPN